LPVFQRSVEEFARAWGACSPKRQNIAFEVHWYHCFENEWHGRTFAQHLRAVQEHAQLLQRYPMVVGEWSLALGCGAQPGRLSHGEMRTLFAHMQMAAYREASHGWFFWTWRDAHGVEWDWQRSYKEGHLPAGTQLHKMPEFPPLEPDGKKDDPLEAVFDLPSSDPLVRPGDTVYLRAFNGRYLDVEGNNVRARYGDRGKWQQFVVCPLAGPSSGTTAVGGGGAPEGLRDGDIVGLLAHTGCFLGVQGRRVLARWPAPSAEKACAFVVRTQQGEAGTEVRHRTTLFLQSSLTSKVLAPNENGCPRSGGRDALLARWKHFGAWQRLTIEKPLCNAVTPPRPRRRSSLPCPTPPLPREPATPQRKSRRSGSESSGRSVKEESRALVIATPRVLKRQASDAVETPRPATAATQMLPRRLSSSLAEMHGTRTSKDSKKPRISAAAIQTARRRLSSGAAMTPPRAMSASTQTPSRKRPLPTKTLPRGGGVGGGARREEPSPNAKRSRKSPSLGCSGNPHLLEEICDLLGAPTPARRHRGSAATSSPRLAPIAVRAS
jgi:hypothetical protein